MAWSLQRMAVPRPCHYSTGSVAMNACFGTGLHTVCVPKPTMFRTRSVIQLREKCHEIPGTAMALPLMPTNVCEEPCTPIS